MKRLCLVLLAVAVGSPPAIADKVKGSAEKRLEQQRKDLTRNWAGRTTPPPTESGKGKKALGASKLKTDSNSMLQRKAGGGQLETRSGATRR